MYRLPRVAVAALVILVWGISAAGVSAAPRHARDRFRQEASADGRKHVDPIYTVAAKHHWNHLQVRYWLDVLWDESRSTLGHYDLWAVNGNCVGAGQLNGGWGAYARYGGSASTALGQLTGMANYIEGRYGSPGGAEAHEVAYGWY